MIQYQYKNQITIIFQNCMKLILRFYILENVSKTINLIFVNLNGKNQNLTNKK